MFSIKGIYKDSKIKLAEPLNISNKANVIITFLEEDHFEAPEVPVGDFPETQVLLDDDELSLDSDDDDLLSDNDDDLLSKEDDDLLSEDDNDLLSEDDEFSENDYTKIRKHKRYQAKGSISLVDNEEEQIYPLYDYSAGGLSFISDKPFEVGRSLTASIKDPIEQDTSVLDFEFEVARIENTGDNFKIGCKFFDEVDEEIWHSLMN
jgi:hypothetical protein